MLLVHLVVDTSHAQKSSNNNSGVEIENCSTEIIKPNDSSILVKGYFGELRSGRYPPGYPPAIYLPETCGMFGKFNVNNSEDICSLRKKSFRPELHRDTVFFMLGKDNKQLKINGDTLSCIPFECGGSNLSRILKIDDLKNNISEEFVAIPSAYISPEDKLVSPIEAPNLTKHETQGSTIWKYNFEKKDIFLKSEVKETCEDSYCRRSTQVYYGIKTTSGITWSLPTNTGADKPLAVLIKSDGNQFVFWRGFGGGIDHRNYAVTMYKTNGKVKIIQKYSNADQPCG